MSAYEALKNAIEEKLQRKRATSAGEWVCFGDAQFCLRVICQPLLPVAECQSFAGREFMTRYAFMVLVVVG